MFNCTLSKLRAQEFNVNKSYSYNNRFKVSRHNSFFRDGEVVFPADPDYLKILHDGLFDPEYKTHFGMRFYSETQFNSCSNLGLRYAARRIMGVREPDIVGLHESLIDNQYNNILITAPRYASWLEHFGTRLNELLPIGSAEELRYQWTIAPHPKMKLRRKAMKDLWDNGRVRGVRLKKVDYKCKSTELLAPNKYLRAVGDLTCPGSTVGGYLMEYVKKAFAIPYYYNGGCCRYIAPTRETMLENFDDLVNLKHNVYFNFFSDDSNIAVQCADGILRANCDISQCDGSNFAPIFNLLKAGMLSDGRFSEDIENIFQQCLCACELRSTQAKRREQRHIKLKLKPKEPVLYSGSVLTTSINNMANTCIFIEFMRLYRRNLTMAEVSRLIEQAAANAGFILKVERCENIQSLQFLKHSPTGDGGMFLNLGTILRGFGMCQGDLPGSSKLTIEERAHRYVQGVIGSYAHAGKHIITNAIRTFGAREERIEYKAWHLSGQGESQVSSQDLCDRYDCSVSELYELADDIAKHGLRCCIYRSELTDKIFKVDYGY